MPETLVKCCGLRRPEDIAAVNKAGADFAGFIMSRGYRRYVPPEEVLRLRSMLGSGKAAVGVFVDEPAGYPEAVFKSGAIDLIQLHGSENDAYIERLRELIKGSAGPGASGRGSHPLRGSIIKAFKIKSAGDIDRAAVSKADYILLDSGTGTGTAFDWSLIRNMERPYFFAGGLNPENVKEAVRSFHPFAVDVSSGIETGGIKDPAKIMEFVENARAGSD